MTDLTDLKPGTVVLYELRNGRTWRDVIKRRLDWTAAPAQTMYETGDGNEIPHGRIVAVLSEVTA